MPLRRLAVENYRSFRDRHEIEIRPVTVVLGKNNSGKSALVRAPLVADTGFHADTSAPLDLERLDVEPVDTFTDLIFEGSPHGRIGLGVEVGGEAPFRLDATIQHVAEEHDAFVSDLRIDADDVRATLSWIQELVSGDAPRKYEIDVSGAPPRQAHVRFRGLVPVDPPPALRSWAARPPSLGTIRYLSPYREPVARQHRLPLGPPQALGAHGQGVASVLADDRARSAGAVIARVNEYLRALVPDWQLGEIQVAPPLWSTVLTRDHGRVQVNLADAGAGLSQALPMLVQCALDELDERTAHGSRGALQIVEEPEMHLHPGAHAELADLYLRVAQHTDTRFLVETHSETLLLRLRRRIAEGSCDPDMVAVYMVEQRDGVSSVARVGLDELGNLQGDAWPDGYFSTDYQDARALAAAQVRRSRE